MSKNNKKIWKLNICPFACSSMCSSKYSSIFTKISILQIITYIPLLAGILLALVLFATISLGHTLNATSISENGATGLGIVVFTSSLLIYLPLWIITLCIYHNEKNIRQHIILKDVPKDVPKSDNETSPLAIVHSLVGVVGVIAYACIICLPITQTSFELLHDFWAAVYFLSMYLHIFLSIKRRPFKVYGNVEERMIHNSRYFIWILASILWLLLLSSLMCKSNWQFTAFEIVGGILTSIYIATFSLEFQLFGDFYIHLVNARVVSALFISGSGSFCYKDDEESDQSKWMAAVAANLQLYADSKTLKF